MKLFSRLSKNFFDNTLFADFFSWNGAGLKTGLYLGIIILFSLPFKAHAQYSSMDTLGYWVKYSNGQQEKHEGILVEPPDMNVMFSEDPYYFLHMDRWVTWVYNNFTDNLDNFWAGFDKLPGDKKQRYIPDYDLLGNNPPHHEPDTDGEIVELYTFNISSNDNDQSLPVDFVDSAFRVRYRSEENTVYIKWQTMSETDNMGFRVLREIRKADGSLRQLKKDISGLIAGLGNSAMGQVYYFKDKEVLAIACAGDTVKYSIKQIDFTGFETEYGPRSIVWEGQKQIAGHFFLFHNYPNPFNSNTIIVFSLPEPQIVTINLFDMCGLHLKTIYSREKTAGIHEISFDGTALASGVFSIASNPANTQRCAK